MSSIANLPHPEVKALALPEDVQSSEQLEQWLEKQKRPIGTYNMVPESWQQHLTARGFVTVASERNSQLVLHTLDGAEPVIPGRTPLKKNQFVFFGPKPDPQRN